MYLEIGKKFFEILMIELRVLFKLFYFLRVVQGSLLHGKRVHFLSA